MLGLVSPPNAPLCYMYRMHPRIARCSRPAAAGCYGALIVYLIVNPAYDRGYGWDLPLALG
jgi:hypothetical protein